MRQSIVIATTDVLAPRMAGPGIRAWEMATILGQEHDVRLVTFTACSLTSDHFSTEVIRVEDFRDLVESVDVVVVQGFILNSCPWIDEVETVVVADLYDPLHLENLIVAKDETIEKREESLRFALGELNRQISRADFMICASEKQRDLWLGHLAALGRANPWTYDDDPELRTLIDVVPFGISGDAPVQSMHAIKGAVPGISLDDTVLLWGGGVYNWFDPITLVRAMDILKVEFPQLRLYFMGMKHPNPDVPSMAVATETVRLADALGLTGTFIFFNEAWIPYADRHNWLLDADIGVSCHFQHIETAFSFRTRILDYLWAGLPIVSTSGDYFGDVIERERLGATVPACDEDALANAIRSLLTEPDALENARLRTRAFAPTFEWSVALEPLREFCSRPHRAADATHRAPTPPAPRPSSTSIGGGLRTALVHLREGGVKQLLAKLRARRRRKQMYG